ncbi:MAG: hypothetical protein R3E66_13600 [bacterium]
MPSNSRYQDPAPFLLAKPGLAILARPEWLPQLTNELPADSELRAGSQANVSMLDGLEQIEKAAPENTLLLMSGNGAMAILPGIGKIRFVTGKVAILNPEAPQVRIDLQLTSGADAQKFVAACPDMKKQLISGVPFLARGMVGNLVNRVRCEATDNYVNIAADYTRDEVVNILGYALAFVPRPAALSQLPVPPPKPAPKPPQEDTPLAPSENLSTTPTQDPQTSDAGGLVPADLANEKTDGGL